MATSEATVQTELSPRSLTAAGFTEEELRSLWPDELNEVSSSSSSSDDDDDDSSSDNSDYLDSDDDISDNEPYAIQYR